MTERPPIVLRACTVDPVRSEVLWADGRREHLSPRERDLLVYLVEHADRSVPRDELLTEVWQYAPTVVSRAVDTTVRRLREKIESDPQRPDHLLTAFGEGYRFVPRSDPLTGLTGELGLTGEGLPAGPAGPATPEAEPFVGRTAEVRWLLDALAAPGAAVVLVGPPGAGKTRLARHLAHRLGPVLRGGTVLVDVTECRDLAEVGQAAAAALGVDQPGTGAQAVQRVGDALRARGPCLVVVDNCEGVGDPVGEAVRTWQGAADGCRFLATSRQLLDGFAPVQLGALPLADGVALFELLAQRVRPDFAVGPVRAVVEELVERLERIPLALALAAGRIHALSPRAILDRLDDRFRVLASRDRSDLRHATLRAALDGSWELLSEPEQDVLLACSAFRGGFDRSAARRVVGAPDTDLLLDRLCARSLLEPRGPDRLGGYAFVREYLSERLAADPAREEAVFRRHAAHFAAIDVRGVRGLALDRSNLIAASERSVARGWAELAGPATLAALEAVSRQGPFEQGVTLGAAALAVPGLALEHRVRIGIRLATLEQWTGRGDPVATQAAVSALAAASGDPSLVAQALRSRAVLARSRGGPADALDDVLAGLALVRASGDPEALSTTLCTLGNTYRELGRIDEAVACWEEVLGHREAAANEDNVINALGNLALVARRRGEFDRARALYEEALRRKIDLGDLRGEGNARIGLANLELDLGRWDAARTQYDAVRRIAVELGAVEMEARVLGNLALCERAVGRLDEARALGEAALAGFDRMGERRQAAVARGNLGELELVEGNPDLAAATLARAVRDLLGDGDRRLAAELMAPWGEALIALGELGRAREVLTDAEALARPYRDPILLAQILARRGLLELGEGGDPTATLTEAETLAAGTRPTSEAQRAVDRLRIAMSGSGPSTGSGSR